MKLGFTLGRLSGNCSRGNVCFFQIPPPHSPTSIHTYLLPSMFDWNIFEVYLKLITIRSAFITMIILPRFGFDENSLASHFLYSSKSLWTYTCLISFYIIRAGLNSVSYHDVINLWHSDLRRVHDLLFIFCVFSTESLIFLVMYVCWVKRVINYPYFFISRGCFCVLNWRDTTGYSLPKRQEVYNGID